MGGDLAGEVLAPGTLLDQYRVVRLAGRGGMGEVYLARDVQLGRKVALKVIRPHGLPDPRDRERFLFEARATAQVSHPNVVTIYTVGEHAGLPYLALEWLEGQGLRERMKESPPSLAEALRIMLAVVEGVEAAHRLGILHRDLKPENVVIPADGRVRVVDFGLATVAARPDEPLADTQRREPGADPALFAPPRESESLRGTPLYMAPEQWRAEPCTGATDVWALGLMLFELVEGYHPFESHDIRPLYQRVLGGEAPPELGPDKPRALAALVRRCLERDPSRRPSSVEILQTLRELGGAGPAGGAARAEAPPFRGLLPFTEDQAGLFFGRAGEISAFLERLRVEPVLPVVGPSGAGKTSFVQAGVLPRLREQGRWLVLRTRPGHDPFGALAARLLSGEHTSSGPFDKTLRLGEPQAATVPTAAAQAQAEAAAAAAAAASRAGGGAPPPAPAAASRAAALAAELRQAPGRLAVLLDQIAENERARVLLLVEQLEEVCTHLDDPDERRRYMEAICSGADDPDGRVRVVFTLRDDFLGKLAETRLAREVLGRVTVLRSPAPDSLEEILVRCVESAGYRWEDPALPGQMVREVEREPAALSLLQFAGEAIWERRDREARLLTRAAFAEVGGVAGALARHADAVLAGLTPQQVGLTRQILLRLVTPDGNRRVLPAPQAVEGLGPQAPEVLDRLVGSRMVLAHKPSQAGGDAQVEIVHETLVRAWDRLARWIEEGREQLSFLAEVEQAAELWEKRGRRRDEVWRREALAEARRKAQALGPSRVPGRVREFLEAGSRLERRRARRRRLALASVVGVLCVVAAALAFQNREVRTQRERAEERGARALLEGARAALAGGEPLEARAKLRSALEVTDSVEARAMWREARELPDLWHKRFGSAVQGAAFSPDGTRLAAVTQDATLYLLDTRTREAQALRGHKDQLLAVAWSPDGRQVATGSWSGEVGLWDLSLGRLRVLGTHPDAVLALAFDEGSSLLAAADVSGNLKLWEIASGRGRELTRGGFMTHSMAFSAGTLVSVDSKKTVRRWDVSTGRELGALEAGAPGAEGLALSHSGRLLAVSFGDGRLRIQAADGTGTPVNIAETEGQALLLAFDRAESLLASGGYRAPVALWSTRDGSFRGEFPSARGSAQQLAFSDDGALLAVPEIEGNLRLFRTGRALPRLTPMSHSTSVCRVAFRRDGRLLASAGSDGVVLLWDVERGVVTHTLRGHTLSVDALAFHPGGTLLATGSKDKTVRLWDPQTGASLGVRQGYSSVNGLCFSPDGRLLASAGGDAILRVARGPDWVFTAVPSGGQSPLRSVACSADGRRVAASSMAPEVYLWDATTWARPKALKVTDSELWEANFDPTGRLVSVSGSDGTLGLFDIATGEPRGVVRLPGRVYRHDLHPDGRRLGGPTSEGVSVIWDSATGGQVTLRGHRGEVNSLRFSPDGRFAATGGDDATVRLWRVEDGRPAWHTKALLTGPAEVLTHAGWTRLPALPAGAAAAAPSATKGGGSAAWRKALSEQARSSSAAADGRSLCLATFDDRVELWDRASDRRLAAEPIDALDQVVATGDGCLTLSRGGAARLVLPGATRPLREQASAIGYDAGRALVAGERQVAAFDESGASVGSWPVDVNVTAVALAGGILAVGYRDGNVELSPVAGPPAQRRSLDEVPAAAVTRIVPGPAGTLVVGYANGAAGLWAAASGRKLQQLSLHGGVTFAALDGDWLHLATELGDFRSVDLGVLRRPWCEVLREVWSEVPVLWQEGAASLKAPPADHPCAGR